MGIIIVCDWVSWCRQLLQSPRHLCVGCRLYMSQYFRDTWIKDIALPALCGLAVALFYLQYQKIQRLETAVANIQTHSSSAMRDTEASAVSYADAAEPPMPAEVNV